MLTASHQGLGESPKIHSLDMSTNTVGQADLAEKVAGLGLRPPVLALGLCKLHRIDVQHLVSNAIEHEVILQRDPESWTVETRPPIHLGPSSRPLNKAPVTHACSDGM
jgi:hypothetical protein